MVAAVTQKFIPGPRLIDGSDLNTLVDQINGVLVNEGQMSNTDVSDATGATLTAAQVVAGLITRTGPTAVFTDTTPTAVLLVAALPGVVAGQSFMFYTKNMTAFNQTIAAGSGVTLSGNVIVPAHTVGAFLVTVSSATAVAMRNLQMAPLTTVPPEINTAYSTTGVGTLSATIIAGGVVTRTGQSAAATDTTDTAALIIAARPNIAIGDSWIYTYVNTGAFPLTLTGGTGVTVSVLPVIPALSWGRYLVTYTAAATLTMVGITAGPIVPLAPSQFSTTALQSATITVGGITGAQICSVSNTGVTPANLNFPSGTQLAAGLPNGGATGLSWLLLYRNDSGSANTATITTNTGITLTGTMTIAQNVTRTFCVTQTGAAAFTVQSMGISAAGA